MAIVQISKIQHRTGANVDLPQLDEGELGFATDDRKLYIGNDASLYPPIGETTTQTEILTEYSNISMSQIEGSANANLNITSATDGQLLALGVSGSNVQLVNRGGASGTGNINLGNIANVKILGGVNGYVLQTDSTGNLSWTSKGTVTASIANVSNANPMVMTVANTLPYTNSMLVTISGVQGTNANTILNGQSFYIKVATDFPTSGNLSLYTDSGLSVGANGFYLTATANTGRAVSQLGSGGSGSVAGSNTQVQFNDNSTFGGSANLTFNKITGTLSTVLIGGTLTTAAQPNITSVGTLTSANVSGNVTASRLISNIATGTAPVTVTSTTRVANLNVAQAGVSDNVTITTLSTGTYYPTFVNAVTGNLAEGANATYVANIANGSFAATTFVGALSGAATTAGTVTTAAQPNITSVGTLSSLGVSGAVTASTLVSNVATGTAPLTVTSTTRVANLNVSYANVSDFITVTTQTSGNAYLLLANALTGNISETANAVFVANASNGALYATTFIGALSGAATTAGTVTTNAQPNITSVGTLSALSVTGNVSAGNINGANLIAASYLNGNLAWSYITGEPTTLSGYGITDGVANTRTITAGTGISGGGNLSADRTITNTGVLSITAGTGISRDSANGNVTVTNTGVVSLAASGSGLSVNASNGAVTATLASTTLATANTVVYRDAAASFTANVVNMTTGAASLSIQTPLLTTGSNATAGTITGNWSLSAGSQLRATYADLAEYYVGDAKYDPGTVMMFGGSEEVTVSDSFATRKVAGIVSTSPAYIMNNALSKTGVCLALVGRVPCKVYGTINKGDLMVAGEWPGTATSWTSDEQPPAGSILGKAIEAYDNPVVGVIEVVVGRI
jgi:hypothetical protein